MKFSIDLERDQLEKIKTSLDLTASYWRKAAENENEENHRTRFLELHSEYSALRDEIKTFLK
ncbi:hypothetical protein [Rufibacter sp. XAAS-G3-1]|uniref:hypothetical protein n=1 Tax=Rufibacter sp. XAAS-G3-1 TaxID=2729134 RepID=UPI0015E6E250|nr:hypothetical protein [Rufibacter sp. XAAS-G3-1]